MKIVNFIAITIGAILSCILTFSAAFTQKEILASLRLPTNFIPKTYNITLRPYLLESDGKRRFTFDGEVYIDITRVKASRVLEFHAKDLNFTLGEYWSAEQPDNKITIPLEKLVSDKVTNKINLDIENGNDIGVSYTLHFIYNGIMGDDMHGFYKSYYTDDRNVTKWLGSTHFEPNYARRAFPSLDEPKFKAKFDLSLIRHKTMNTYSNTRIKDSVQDGDYFIDTYQRTPKMSTYLLAFIISEFKERSDDGNFGVIARPELYNQTEYSAIVGKKLLAEFDAYLKLPYYGLGNDNFQMAAIPDFDSGAMENWGLVTYRERSLLFDYNSSALRDRQNIATTIAHEQAHMWFGNLVTCEWWSYIWLNEGFARYFEQLVADKVEEGLKMQEQFVVDRLQSIMLMDSTNKTNPLSNEALNIVNDTKRIFNTITYDKGASFIRMISYILGEKNFRGAMEEYLRAHKYENTVPADLFAVWTKYWPAESKDQASLVFRSFTEQVGYPLVTIKVSHDGKSMRISQRRYLSQPDDGSDPTLLYTVPLTYTTNLANDFKATVPELYLKATTATRTVYFAKPVEWVIANIQETGYYRVNYDRKTWQNIQHALLSPNWGGIHELNRAQIVDDLFQLAQVNEIDYELALTIFEYLKTELNYLPWKAAFNGYAYLAKRLGKDSTEFSVYIRQQLEKVYNILGFDERPNDTAFDKYNRVLVLRWSCKYGNTQCVAEVKKRFRQLQKNPLPANIRSIVYCVAVREGNEADFNLLYNKYKTETVQTERVMILTALGCVRDKNLIEKYYNIISSENVRLQDKRSSMNGLINGNRGNYVPIFEFIKRDLEKIAKIFNGYDVVAGFINNVASNFNDENEEKMLQEFVKKNKQKFGSSAKNLDATLKMVAKNRAWSKKYLHAVKHYLEKRAKGAGNTISSFKALTIALVPLFSLIVR